MALDGVRCETMRQPVGAAALPARCTAWRRHETARRSLRCAALAARLRAAPRWRAHAQTRARSTAAGQRLHEHDHAPRKREKLGCKRLEGAPVTVIQMTQAAPPAQRRRAGGRARSGAGAARRSGGAQRARDSDARRILEAELQGRGGPAGRHAEGVQQRRARAAGRRAELPEVPGPRRRDAGRDRAQARPTSPRSSARSRSCRRRLPQ